MKYAEPRPYADPEKAARRIIEIASTVEPVQDGRIFVELINGPFLFKDKGSPAEYGAGMKLALERGWLAMHESGTFVTVHACRCRAVRVGRPTMTNLRETTQTWTANRRSDLLKLVRKTIPETSASSCRWVQP